MVFNLNVASIFGSITLASIIFPALYSLRKQCFSMDQNVLLTKALSIGEPILKCANDDGIKDYSVFLVLADGSRSSNTRVARLKVVDNKDHQIKWEGPNNSFSRQWSDWALEIWQDRSNGDVEKTSIKVPKNGSTFRKPSDGVSIVCQTSQLQLKQKRGATGCSGSALRGSKMKLDLQANNITISSTDKESQFDWKDDFKKRPVFCTF